MFPGEGKGFIQDFGDMGPVVEVFDVGELEFGGAGWHVSIIRYIEKKFYYCVKKYRQIFLGKKYLSSDGR